MFDRLRRLVGLAPVPPAPAPVTTPAVQVPAYGAWTPDAAWIARRRSMAATYAGVDDATVKQLVKALPDASAATVAAAERAIRHEFNLLGSGPFVPVDPDRQAHDGYQPIDWYLDPVRKLRFPRGVHHKAWNLYEMRPANADVKYPWELARCQHWAALGQAFRITGDERFAREVAAQLDDFVAANPVGVGINWTCTMDVGLRAVSWVVALDLIRGSRSLDEAFWSRAYSALFDHGLFTRGNLENTYEVTSNHFLSNVVGLWFMAAMFDDLADGRAWSAFARDSLETEIDVQVLPDGADFESSVPYHRLVAELFLGSARLAEHRGQPLSPHYRNRVHDMVTYLAAVTRPDGLMPQSGDADDGRLHVFGDGAATPQDARHLFGPASLMYTRDEWMSIGGPAARWEAGWWGLDAANATAVALPAVCQLFPDAGHAVVRDGGLYLLITNSIVGTRGFGNHKHNDQLAFEYHAGGRAFVVDAGSYVYTSDPGARNLFRGTGYHNTLMIDGVEQNEFNPEWLFRMFEKAQGEHVSFGEDGSAVTYAGRHTGYSRLPEPVTHDRSFRLDRASSRLEIHDWLSGAGRHRLAWHFHFAPGVSARLASGACMLTAANQSMELSFPKDLAAAVSDAWYSPSYGVRVPCQALDLTTDVEVGSASQWSFTFMPKESA
jgi:hypothetical protein